MENPAVPPSIDPVSPNREGGQQSRLCRPNHRQACLAKAAAAPEAAHISKKNRKEVTEMAKNKPMNKQDAARIQAATAKQNAGKTPKKSFGARAQSAADKRGK